MLIIKIIMFFIYIKQYNQLEEISLYCGFENIFIVSSYILKKGYNCMYFEK